MRPGVSRRRVRHGVLTQIENKDLPYIKICGFCGIFKLPQIHPPLEDGCAVAYNRRLKTKIHSTIKSVDSRLEFHRDALWQIRRFTNEI